jgi:hypothetical protein
MYRPIGSTNPYRNLFGSTGYSKSHATHGEMQYKFYFCIIMPISNNEC